MNLSVIAISFQIREATQRVIKRQALYKSLNYMRSGPTVVGKLLEYKAIVVVRDSFYSVNSTKVAT